MNNKQPKSGLSIAVIILSIIGCVFLIGIISIICFVGLKRLNTKETVKETTEATSEASVEANSRDELRGLIATTSKKYCLSINYTEVPEMWDIIEIHGDSKDDMKLAFIDICKYINGSPTDEELGKLFDDNVGEDSGVSCSYNDIDSLIFSAPTEAEPEYRVDIYTSKYVDK
jgi:hypothetical protein